MNKPTFEQAHERLKEICKEKQWRHDAIINRQKSADIVERREYIVKLMRYEGFSFPQIAKAMNRHHTSIMHLADDERRAQKNIAAKTRMAMKPKQNEKE